MIIHNSLVDYHGRQHSGEVYPRRLNLNAQLAKKSLFLLGPRTTGKSTLIAQQLPQARVYDLLDASVYARLLREPRILGEETSPEVVVAIDEIQKMPQLLDEVHRLIQRDRRRFLLTGSSARKLKRGAANLLAGRAWEARLFPLTSAEVPDFDLLRFLNRGGLPQIYDSEDHLEELRAYVTLYLREEVQAEALTRNLPAFARFLDAIALNNGEELNFQGLASDCGLAASTVVNYVQILEDTLLGFSVPAFRQTKKRKAITRAKHFLFDVGVTNALCRRGAIAPKSELFGRAFEHFIMMELRAYLSYARKDLELAYWRSASQFEVDVVVGNELAVEIKGTDLVTDRHLKGLRALKEEKNLVRAFGAVSLDPHPRVTEDGIRVWPWREFLASLWAGDLLR
jgi:predicted AAA+ superfamily ATPase